jgi:DNA polymerase-3 subunit alpha
MKSEICKDECGLEHIHRHTDYSLLDGFATVQEYAEYSKSVNQKYLCVTDHGMMGVIPSQIRACKTHDLKPLFGIEAYYNSHQPALRTEAEYKKYVEGCSEADKEVLKKSYHLLAVAASNEGYANLVKLSSWAYAYGRGGQPRRPRINAEQLAAHKEGIIFTSCCYLGEIGQAFDRKGPDAAEDMLCKYMAQFGDHFYLEIMLLDFKKQKPYDAWLVKMHDKYHIPIIVTQDCHYCKKEDSKYQRLTLMTRTKNTVQDIEAALAKGDAQETFFELQDQNLWMKSEDELNEKWEADFMDIVPYEIFCTAKRNTVEVCRRAEGVTIDRSIKLPKLPDAEEKLWDALKTGYKWRGLSGPKYASALRKEYELICRKDFASYFLITKMFCDEGRRICPQILGWGSGAEALAPGRGSAVGFLSCYVLGITDVDPIKHDLLPERFLSDARGGRQLILTFDEDPIN